MKIVTIEHHDGALAIWRDAGVTQRTLLHIDAHSDLYGDWQSPRATEVRPRVNNSNFIYPALEAGLVSRVIWVVPDASWTPEGRRDIAEDLRRCDPGVGRHQRIANTDAAMMATALGCPVHVCTLANLPRIDEPVLLDIDVDYFVIPSVGSRSIDVYGRLPWMWPTDLCRTLDARSVSADIATIAYSVEGGFTPLQWKYLGDELAARLADDASLELPWADHLRAGAEAAARGDVSEAERCYALAGTSTTAAAPSRFHLAHLCAAQGRVDDARAHWRAALEADPTYRTSDNSSGWWYVYHRRWTQARRAFERVIACDLDDSASACGLGIVAICQGEFEQAERWLRAATAADSQNIDSWRALARVLARRGAWSEAAVALERSLRLALTGQRPRHEGNLSEADDRVWDPDHRRVTSELAGLYARVGDWPRALAAARMAAADESATSGEWLRLASIAIRSGRWFLSASAVWSAITAIPATLQQFVRRSRTARRRSELRRRAAAGIDSASSRPALWL